MALVLKDRVKETATSPGTGTVTLQGAVTGYSSFSVIGNGNTTFYTIADQSGNNWEVGIGTYTSSSTSLSRDTVLANSLNTTALINFSSGVQDVFVTYPAERSAYVNGTILVPANSGQLPISTGVSGLGTGIASALGTNVGTAGSVVVNGGALGTPSSGNLTNVTIPLANVTGIGSIASQNANNVAITGGAIDGTTVGATTRSQVYATYIGLIETATGGAVTLSGTSGGQVAIGRTDNVASTPTLQFNSAATSSDFDVSMEASGGTGTPGQGTLNIAAGSVQVNSAPVITTTSTNTLTNKTLTDPVFLNTTTLRGSGVSAYTPFVQTFSAAKTSFNGYQLNYIQNANNGTDASVDYVAYNDASDVDSYFIDMGIVSSNYTSASNTVFPANSGYVYTGGGTSGQASNLVLGTSNPASDLVLFTGGTLTADTRMTVKGNTGHILIGTTTDTGETLQVDGDVKITGATTFGGTVTLDANPTVPLEAATKAYVDQQVTAGVHIHEPVLVETTGNLTATYAQGGTLFNITAITSGTTVTTSVNHGLNVNDQIWLYTTAGNGLSTNTAYFVYSTPALNQLTLSLTFGGPQITGLTNATGLTFATRANSGINATLTNAGTQVALVVDDVTMAVNDRVMVRLQTLGQHNGVYVVTNIGSGSTNWVLTRADDASFVSPADPDGLGTGDYFYTISGTLNAGDSHVLTTEPNTMIIGYTPLTYTQFSGSVDYVGGTNITVTGQTINVSGTIAATLGGTGTSTVTTGDLLYGSATNTWSKLPLGVGYKTLSVNSGGTQLEWNAVALNQAAAVSGQLGISNGGTGLSALGTGVQTALGTNPGTAGAFAFYDGALGTPSSATLTNATGLPLSTGVTGFLPVGNGGTGQTSYTDGQLLIGNSTGGTLSKSTLTAGGGITITNGSGTITIAATGGAPVTSVTGTSPVVSSGGTTPAISLDSGYGDTQNPYASKTANFILAAPNGIAGVPTFRAVVAADIPTLNQNTTGTAAGISGSQTANTVYAAPNGSAGTASFRALVSADVPTLNQNTTGYAANLAGGNNTTLLGSVHYQSDSNVTTQLAPNTTTNKRFLTQTGTGTNGAAPGWNAILAADVPTLNQNTTGSAATLTTSRSIYGGSFNGSADVTGIISASFGGTGNGFTSFSGPATSTKTFTLPNANATILTDNALVTAAQGGTGNGFFQVSGPTTTTRTYTFPDASTTILTTNALVTAAQGGTGNGFFAVSGPATSTKTFTFPNASATVLTTNALVTAAQGGTGNGFTQFSGPTTATKTFTLPDANATLLYDAGPLGTPASGNVGACTIDGTNLAGYRGVPLNVQVATNYTTVLSDAGKAVTRPTGDATIRTFTIASSSGAAPVTYPNGTVISFMNFSATSLLIAADTGDTLTLAGTTTTGTRTLAQNGLATAIRTGSSSWLVSGVGLT